EVPAEAWERVVKVNLLGTAAVVRAALPWLERSRGAVVTVASTLGLRAVSDATAYCASKFGVVGFTRALAAETAGRVGVTLLVPGGMHTAFFDARPEQYKPGADAKLNRPEDVAKAVLFALCQPPGCEARELLVAPSTESSWAAQRAARGRPPAPDRPGAALEPPGPLAAGGGGAARPRAGRPAHRGPGPAGPRRPPSPAPAPGARH